MKVYTASGWIAASSASVATLATFEFVATAGQTVFTGADANSATLSYVAPALIVTLNGVRLRPGDDYTATNGTSITLISAAALNDELVVDAFGSFLVANTVDLSTAQTVGGTKTFSNPITASAGTVSAPGITTTGDSNTGIFFPVADTIAFAEGGAEVMRIDASGNLLVGQTTAAIETGSIVTAKNLEITRTVDSDGAALGQLSWVNNTNAGAGSGTSFVKDVACIKGIMDGTGNNSGGYITFETKADAGSRAERMRIDSSGRVTTPFRPAFFIRKDTSQTISSGTLITFTNVTTNIGSHFNTSTSRFTAPVAGVYSFSARVIINRNGLAYANINPCVNGSAIPAAGAYYDSAINSTGFANYGQTLQYYLNAGDYVDWIVGGPAGSLGVDNSGYFCGFLVG
jgi:hypothetical protein